MDKDKAIKILRHNGANTACCGFVIFESEIEKIATEIAELTKDGYIHNGESCDCGDAKCGGYANLLKRQSRSNLPQWSNEAY